MRNVLIVGGDGMLGRMVQVLLQRSEDVHLVATSRRENVGNVLDASQNLDRLRSFFVQSGHFDYVVNCVGILQSDIFNDDPVSVGKAIRINSLFPHFLDQVAQESGIRVIHISTDAVFSERSGMCYEDTPADSNAAYGKSKYLGEVCSPTFLSFRCSIVGPNPFKKKGLLEWFLARKSDEKIDGYIDHLWGGVTTLQFAQLCRDIIRNDNLFDLIRSEGPVHHFCPNKPTTKYELIEIFRSVFGASVQICSTKSPNGSITRLLDTNYKEINSLFGSRIDVSEAVEKLAEEMRNGSYFSNQGTT